MSNKCASTIIISIILTTVYLVVALPTTYRDLFFFLLSWTMIFVKPLAFLVLGVLHNAPAVLSSRELQMHKSLTGDQSSNSGRDQELPGFD